MKEQTNILGIFIAAAEQAAALLYKIPICTWVIKILNYRAILCAIIGDLVIKNSKFNDIKTSNVVNTSFEPKVSPVCKSEFLNIISDIRVKNSPNYG